MVSCNKKILRPKAVRFLCSFVLRKTLILCGDVRLFNTSKVSAFDKVLDSSQNCLKFLLIDFSRSIENKYEDLSNLLQQLDSQTILIVTETWISEQPDTNFNEHLSLQNARSKQKGLQRGGCVGVWSVLEFGV